MKTLLILTMLIAAASCTRHRSDPDSHPQIARLMPNGTDIAVATRKCAKVSTDAVIGAACVRALRADVCGDGVAHTVDGTLIELVTGGGNVTDAEAVWTPAGATCVGRHTRPQVQQAAQACGIPVTVRCGLGDAALVTRLAAST